MKLNQTSIIAAAVAGIFAAGTVAPMAATLGGTKVAAEKDSCSGKKKDKDSCSGKDGCSGKEKKKDGQII